MKRVCCYCQKKMGEKEPLEDKRATHGVCKPCFDKQMKEIDDHEKVNISDC